MPIHDKRMIMVESMVMSKTKEPCVRLSWGEESGDLTPNEARDHALNVLQAADAADSDSFLFHFFTNTIGAPEEQAYAMLKEFRTWREKQPGYV